MRAVSIGAMDHARALEPPEAVELHTHDRDRALARLTASQHATISARQLRALGFTRHEIPNLIKTSRLRVVHRGVYAVGLLDLTRKGRWMAALLAAGPGAVLSHRSAGTLWRVLRDDGRRVEVTVGRRLRSRDGFHPRYADLPDDEVTIVDGIPVTTVARTILDLAAVLPRRRVERAMHEADVQRLGDATGLRALVDRYPRRPGTPTLRAIFADYLDVPTRREFEWRFVDFLIDNDLPLALVNHQVLTAGECDFVWPDQRLIVELDGYEAHGTRRQFEKDRQRDRTLQVAGWRVIRVTWRQLRDEPQKLAADLRVLLG